MKCTEGKLRLELGSLKRSLLASGRDVIDLSMFNPDLPPSRFAIDKLLEATVKSSNHRYGVSRGIRKLREAFALKYQRRFAVTLDPETQVCVSLGSKDALERALSCLKAQGYGPKVIVGSPTYPAYASSARLSSLECETFGIEAEEERMFDSIGRALRRFPGSILLLNFPNNPTGVSVSSSFLKKVLCEVEKTGGAVLNDFVYGEMAASGTAFSSLLSCGDTACVVGECYSLSKAYSVPGWRVGALCGSAGLVAAVSALKSQVDYGLFLPLQMAAASVLTAEQDLTSESSSTYFRRCETAAKGLRFQGWEIETPQAGACLWGRIPEKFRMAAARVASPYGAGAQLCRRMLEESGVMALPGEEFGSQWHEYVRFAMVVPEERIREMLGRLAAL